MKTGFEPGMSSIEALNHNKVQSLCMRYTKKHFKFINILLFGMIIYIVGKRYLNYCLE
jgi:hypothetical protein